MFKKTIFLTLALLITETRPSDITFMIKKISNTYMLPLPIAASIASKLDIVYEPKLTQENRRAINKLFKKGKITKSMDS